MEAFLSVTNVSSGYGETTMLNDVTLEIAEGEIVSVIGANGAGKSTLLLTISGHLTARTGRIVFAGVDIGKDPAHQTVARGIVMVPEGSRLFPFMTVKENLELGAYHASARRHLRASLDEVMTLFPILADRQSQLAGHLSGGERQMCAIARAMMSKPRLLMLDEPTLGLAPVMVERTLEAILALVKAKNLTVLLVEQNVADALHMCQRAYVMERGMITKTGPGHALLDDPDVRRAYMSI
jgi:branched-chain amino acid transport system ATP-binding protein